ncbi:hypothetical protein Tco_1035566 [Tanacetum coccineum]
MAELLNADHNADKLPQGKLSTKGVGATASDMSESETLEDGVVVPLGQPKHQLKLAKLAFVPDPFVDSHRLESGFFVFSCVGERAHEAVSEATLLCDGEKENGWVCKEGQRNVVKRMNGAVGLEEDDGGDWNNGRL